MPRLSVPPDQREGLAKLHGLSSAELTELTAALQAAPLRLYTFQLARDVGARTESIPATTIESIIEALWQIEFMRHSLEAPRELFMDDIAQAIATAGITTDLNSFMGRVEQLLRIPSLTVAAKARVLLSDGNSYCRSRVLTDLRPIFGESVDGQPAAAVVVHHLTLSYHTTPPNTADVIVSLDSDDIENLIETLQRAQRKQQELQQLLTSVKVPSLDLE